MFVVSLRAASALKEDIDDSLLLQSLFSRFVKHLSL